ncbi:protein of unknown function (DUF1830) [Synechococcus sp. PCC 7502]|nr:protein of unknown function (DUF1830) [Synechococcus sp. PCC 7502]
MKSQNFGNFNNINFRQFLYPLGKAMSQILDSVPENHDQKLVCCYVNATSKIQVARITNIDNWYFEKVVFPGQQLIFETVIDAQLEIHTGMMASSILSDVIPCIQLQVQDESQLPPSWLPRVPRPAAENQPVIPSA